MDGEYNTHGTNKKCIQTLVGKPEENIPIGRSRCGWVGRADNKIDLYIINMR